MDDMDHREELLKRDGALIGIALLALSTGMHFSPFFEPAYILLRPFAPGFFITSPLLLFYFTSLLVSTATLIIAGVPAALYERLTGRKNSDFRSLMIWMIGCGVLALPPVFILLGF